MNKTISIVDVNMGNLCSVRNSLRRLGIGAAITNDKADIDASDILILPGVGSFSACMNFLEEKQITSSIRRHVLEAKKPILGICLGMQLFADSSEEHGLSSGLGLVPGRIVKLRPTSTAFRVHNMGWCDVHVRKSSALFAKPDQLEAFYFVHSYYFDPEDKQVETAVIQYGEEAITAALEKENILGVQFHPEKSQEAGLNLLEAFFKFAGCL